MKGYLSIVSKTGYEKIKILLFAALVIGFGVRLAPALYMNNKISWEDERDYLDLAQKIHNGQGYVRADGSPTAFRAPGYPMFLALLRFTGIQTPFTIRLVQALLGTAIIWLVYQTGLIIMNRSAALLGAVLTAIYPYYIIMPVTLLAETLFTTLLLAATLQLFLFLRDGRGKLLFGAAITMGLAILTRPAAVALAGGVILWLLISKHFPMKQRVGLAALFIGAVLLTITPWMMRNYMQFGSFTLATNGGRNLWLGNNAASTINTGSNIAMDEVMTQQIESAETETKAEKIYYDHAFRHIKTHPWQFVILTAKKALAFWRWTPSPMTGNSYERDQLMHWLSIFSVAPIFIFAIIGYILAPAELRCKISLWLIFAIFYTATHAIYISKVRFRLPLDAFIILTAAFAITKWFGKLKAIPVMGTAKAI